MQMTEIFSDSYLRSLLVQLAVVLLELGDLPL